MVKMKILGPRCPNAKRVRGAPLQGGIRQRNVRAVINEPEALSFAGLPVGE